MVYSPSAATSPSSPAPGSPVPPPTCRPATFTLGSDNACQERLVLGSKGPMWFLLYADRKDNPIHTPINKLWPTDPFPEPSPDGRPRIAFTSLLDPTVLGDLLSARVPPRDAKGLDAPTHAVVKLTGRMFSKEVPEVEILLDEVETVRGCTYCKRWETIDEPTFKRCGSCKLRFYCSVKCQRVDWGLRHKLVCPHLREGKFREAEDEEVMERMSSFCWKFDDMMKALQSGDFDAFVSMIGLEGSGDERSSGDSSGPGARSGERYSEEEEEDHEPSDAESSYPCSDDSESDWEDVDEDGPDDAPSPAHPRKGRAAACPSNDVNMPLNTPPAP